MIYLILSIKHTAAHSAGDESCIWWGPGDTGYTTDVRRAGRYTEADVEARRDYYDNGISTRAVPVAVAERLVRHVVDVDHLPMLVARSLEVA